MVTHQKMIVFASSIGFTTPWNIVERYSSKNRFKKVQIPKIPPWLKEGCDLYSLIIIWNLRTFYNEIYMVATGYIDGKLLYDVVGKYDSTSKAQELILTI